MKAYRLTLIVYTLSLLLFALKSNSQGYINYHNLCNEASELIDSGYYKAARNNLTEAIHSVDKPLGVDYFNLAKCYSQLNQKDSTFHWWRLAIENEPNLTAYSKLNHAWFKPIFGEEMWDSISQLNLYSRKQLEPEQQELRDKLIRMNFIDQRFRIILDSIELYHYKDSLLLLSYIDSMLIADKYVQKEFEMIINKYGFPSRRILGGSDSAYTFLIHASDEWMAKMDSTLKEEIDKGNLFPSGYANIIDRINLRNDRSPMYNGYFAREKRVTPEVKLNCKTIGCPLGRTRSYRSYVSNYW